MHPTPKHSFDVDDDSRSSVLCDSATVKRVRPITRAPDGRFVLSSSSSSSSISSSIDDGGFLTHPAFRNIATSQSATAASSIVTGSNNASIRSLPKFTTPSATRPPVIYTSHTPFLSSSPASSTAVTPFLSPVYFSDLSSVQQPSSAERTLQSVRAQYSQELPSLKTIHEENERILGADKPPARSRLPPRISVPEITTFTQEITPESSSSGLGSKNTSQQTGSSGTGEWRPPPYRPPPPPVQHVKEQQAHTSVPAPQLAKQTPHLRTWLDYTPSPTHSSVSNKPLSVDGHYEFDPIFPASPTPTEMALTPLPPAVRTQIPTRISRATKQEYIEARVQAMKEEFNEYKRRQAQMKRIQEMENVY